MKKLASKNSNDIVSNSHIAKLLRESMRLFGFAVVLFQYIALISYSKADAAWSTTGLNSQISNIAGFAGAVFADFLLQCFGYLAFIFPALLFLSMFKLFNPKASEEVEFDYNILGIRLFGLLLVVLSISAILSIYLSEPAKHAVILPGSSGGILGDFIGFEVMMELFNYIGSLVLLCAFALIGISLLANISWFNLAKLVLSNLITGSYHAMQYYFAVQQYVLAKLKDWLQRYQDQRAQRKKIAIAQPAAPKKDLTKQLKNTVANVSTKVQQLTTSNIKPSTAKRTNTVASNSEQPLSSLSLLDQKDANAKIEINSSVLEAMSRDVEQKLADFSITVEVVGVQPGPVVTRYEMELAPGIKASKITSLAKDLARSLSVSSVRVVEVIPGKTYVGLEIPNTNREMVLLSEVLETEEYTKAKVTLPLALGKDIAGCPVIVDLAKMPHLLVAGTTGSGKSVGINTMLISLLYQAPPEDVRLILVDPKMLELSVYEDIPHLLAPVVTDMKEAANALRWCVAEMERRYSLMSQIGVRNIKGYNDKITADNNVEMQKLPHIVIVIDEFADMIMVVGKKVEQLIARLAQKARAAGIHMILATQRPSVDVITGLIKSNIPTRIAYQVSSRIDSRTILDQQGAEQLLGHGDMLYLPPGLAAPIRVHGAFVADHEVHKVTEALKKQGKPNYLDAIVDNNAGMSNDSNAEQDELYDQAVAFIMDTKKVSVSSIQRKFRIGYNRAATIVDAMEAAGVVSAMENNGSREVLL